MASLIGAMAISTSIGMKRIVFARNKLAQALQPLLNRLRHAPDKDVRIGNLPKADIGAR
jgi:hypothetical protein